jgi:hypothetical protein
MMTVSAAVKLNALTTISALVDNRNNTNVFETSFAETIDGTLTFVSFVTNEGSDERLAFFL